MTSKAASARSYPELLAAQETERVPEDRLRIFQREEDLTRVAMTCPRAFVNSGVEAFMFHAMDYGLAWSAMRRVLASHEGDGPLLPMSVLAEMRRIEPKRFVGRSGVTWLEHLSAQEPVSIPYALEMHVPEVVSRYQNAQWRDRMLLLAETVPTEPNQVALRDRFRTEAARIASENAGGRLVTTTSEMLDAPPRKGRIIPFGIGPIDRATGGGVGIGDMIVVGAGTGVGKSYFCQRLARTQARSKRPSLYISTEDPPELFKCRMLADFSSPKVTPVSIRNYLNDEAGSAPKAVVETAKDALRKEQNKLVYVADCLKWRVSDICNVIRHHAYTAGVKVVYVDYLQAIDSDEPSNNDTQRISYIVKMLKKCARECGVVLVLMSQLKREAYADGEEPGVNDYKYAGDIENEAELAVLLWKTLDKIIHAKIPKVKWSAVGGSKHIVPTEPVTGCFGDWVDDFSQPEESAPKRKSNRGP